MVCLVCQSKHIACKRDCVLKKFFTDVLGFEKYETITGCVTSGFLKFELSGVSLEEGAKVIAT